MKISKTINDIMPLLCTILLSTCLVSSNMASAAHSPRLNIQKLASHTELSPPFGGDSSTAGDSTLSDAPITLASVQQDPIIAAIFRPSFPDPQGLTDMYKQYVDSEDIIMNARYSMKKYTDQLPGLKATSYVALDDILANVPTLKSHGIDILGFDLEKAFSPDSDMHNPVDVMRQASNAAHNHGLKFMALPGYPFAGKEN